MRIETARNRRGLKGAFTIVELVAIVGMLLLLGSMLGVGLAKSGGPSKAYQCLNNNRRLTTAWRMYADCSRDLIPYASDDGTGTQNPLNVFAWTESHLDSNPANRQNWDITADITTHALWPYTGKNPELYRCVSDTNFVVVGGVARPRVRSVAMNLYLGGFVGTDGGWGPRINPYFMFFKLADLVAPNTPGANKTFLFLDEREDVINWGSFLTDMQGYAPPNPALFAFDEDLPGFYHNRACGFSFCDGHAEIKKWLDPRTTPPLQLGIYNISTWPVPHDVDVAWLQDHTTRPK